MEALLEKYADHGLEALESNDVFKVVPFPQMGTPVELNAAFGKKNGSYRAAIRELEKQLYSESA